MSDPLPEFSDPLLALSHISESINTIYDIDELLRKILTIALQTVNAQRGFILMSEKDDPAELHVRVAHNLEPNALNAVAPFSRSIVEAATASGETLITYNPADDTRFRSSESIFDQKIVAAACLPLRIKTRRLGAIYIDSTETRGKFRPEMEPFLNAFAHQAAIAIENAQMYDQLRSENRRLRQAMANASEFTGIIGQSQAVRAVLDTVRSVMDTTATILILGESGTGKELIARALHYNSRLKDKPFIALFCGALPETLLESELFGHKQGSFTGASHEKKGLFEEADGGTIFLDEIGDISPKIQTALLRVLQEQEVRRIGETKVRKIEVRVLAATNKDLAAEVKAGRFREDLYYRLNVIAIHMPALRYRGHDIILLAQHFLDRAASKAKRQIAGFSPEALEALLNHDWPGNVRELGNTIERAVLLAKGEYLTPADLRLQAPAYTETTELQSLRDHERRIVERVLQQHQGNVTEAAKALGVSRRWLHYRLKEWQNG
ncbi:sigma-54-dependent Fis family transcriptional regulator [candidate division KSB1 bacterium]|nr:MAG: sigma-54-dependent Fis family transcriptional regulator [candidate division KSB1 bacterium]MCE7944495.1 sigma-54-dependent Fis family transcriptional regulator [Chlorobi bacterium CHB1]MDL1874794.1 sigma-54-dependent Fis family transcriptional regulator [Cytophagia bacterium CHB2]